MTEPVIPPPDTHNTSTDLPSHEQDHSTHALYIRTTFMLVLFLITINLHGFAHKMKFHYIGESALTILFGLIIATGFTVLSYSDENTTIQLSSKFFYMVLLPPIIFEGGFNLRRVSFFKNFLTIFSLAFIGALYSTFVTSLLMYFFSKLVFPLSFIESLVFGSLISSTDPVTVLSLLPSNVDRRLYMLIFGESALNDAVSIILYRFFSDIADPKMRLGVGTFLMSVVASTGVFVGSFLVGIVVALFFAKVTKHVHMENRPIYETTMLLVCAYLSYLIADLVELTGIISIFFCGIGMAHYAYPNLSSETTVSMKIFLRFLSSLCEGFIFLYLGLGLLSFGGKTHYNPLMILFASISILISRTHVFIILGISNLFARQKSDKVPFNHQVLMWFSGLRGAVAFALGVTFLENPVFAQDVKGMIFGTTVMVIIFTIVVLGGLTPHMLKWLGILSGGGAHGAEVEVVVAVVEGEGTGYKEVAGEAGDEEEGGRVEGTEKKMFFSWLLDLDTRYMRKFFSNTSPTAPVQEEQIETPVIKVGGSKKKKEKMSVKKSSDLNNETQTFHGGEPTEEMVQNVKSNDSAELSTVDLH